MEISFKKKIQELSTQIVLLTPMGTSDHLVH